MIILAAERQKRNALRLRRQANALALPVVDLRGHHRIDAGPAPDLTQENRAERLQAGPGAGIIRPVEALVGLLDRHLRRHPGALDMAEELVLDGNPVDVGASAQLLDV